MTTLSMPVTDGPQIPRTETTSTLFPGLELAPATPLLPMDESVATSEPIATPTFEAALGAAARAPKLPLASPTTLSISAGKESEGAGPVAEEIRNDLPRRQNTEKPSSEIMESALGVIFPPFLNAVPIKHESREVEKSTESAETEIPTSKATRCTPEAAAPATLNDEIVAVNSKTNSPIFERPAIELTFEKTNDSGVSREMKPMPKARDLNPSSAKLNPPASLKPNAKNSKTELPKIQKTEVTDSVVRPTEPDFQSPSIEGDSAALKKVPSKLEILQGPWNKPVPALTLKAGVKPTVNSPVNNADEGNGKQVISVASGVGFEISERDVRRVNEFGTVEMGLPDFEPEQPLSILSVPFSGVRMGGNPLKREDLERAAGSLETSNTEVMQPETNESPALPALFKQVAMATNFPILSDRMAKSEIEEPAQTNSQENSVGKQQIIAESTVESQKPKSGLKSKSRESGVNRNLIERFMLEHPMAMEETTPIKSIGTSTASKDLEMKNPVHLNKIAALEKGLPEMNEVNRAMSMKSITSAGQEMPIPLQIHGMSGIIPAPVVMGNDFKLDVAVSPKIHPMVENLFERISNESQLLKVKDASSVSFRFQPDNKSDLVIQINREGHGFRVTVGCDEASNARMSASWGELQDRLKMADIAVEPLKTLPQEQQVAATEKQNSFDLDQQRKGRNPFLPEAREPEMHWAGGMAEAPGKRSSLTKTMNRNHTGWEGVA